MKDYIGDGVYAEWNGYDLTLTTENGISTTNRIVLDSSVFNDLLRFIDRTKEAARAARKETGT